MINPSRPSLAARVLVPVLLAVTAAAGLSADVTIEGRVVLPPGRGKPVVNQRYEIVTNAGVVSTDPPVAVVYLEGDFPRDATPPVFSIGQKDMTFVPSLLPVRKGSRVEFPNFDTVYHNIFSYSPAKRFDLGRYRPDEKPVPSVLFDVPGLIVLRCDIHDHMRGLILVVDTPHFVLSDAEGRFRLTGLPAGNYTLKVWLNSQTTLSRAVELVEGRTLHLDFP